MVVSDRSGSTASRAVLLVVAACATSLLFATLAEAVCELPSNLGKLSVCKGNARDVVIGPSGGPNCNQVVVDQSFTGQKGFGKITIEKGGRLFVPDVQISLDAERIEVLRRGDGHAVLLRGAGVSQRRGAVAPRQLQSRWHRRRLLP